MIDELKKWLKTQRGDMLALHEAMGHDSTYGAAKALEMVLKHIEYLEGKDDCSHEWVTWPEWSKPTHNRCINCDYREDL